MPSPAVSTDIELHAAAVEDLHDVRRVIALAVDAWPTTTRLKRAALAVLAYDAVDLRDTRVLMARSAGGVIGIAGWRAQIWMADPDGQFSALLHGLFVDQSCQHRGVGRLLQRAVAAEVMETGGHGLHVRAERFAAAYFERCGYRRLGSGELVGVTGAYPHRFWSACSDVLRLA